MGRAVQLQIMSLLLCVATEDLDPALKKAIGLAASFEVPGVRLNTRAELNVGKTTGSAIRQTLHFVKERQMKVAGLYCPTRHALYDAEFLEPRLDVIRQSMSLCRKLETTELLIRCGRIPDPQSAEPKVANPVSIDEAANPFSFSQAAAAPRELSGAAQFTTLTELLNDLAQHGNHVGCTLNLILTDYDQIRIQSLLNSVTTGPLNITFDPATAVMTGASVAQTYRDLYRHIGYIRARDALKDVDGAGAEAAVSDGTVSWIELLPTLAEADYRGWFCVERTGGDNRRDGVRRGVSFIKSLMPQTES